MWHLHLTVGDMLERVTSDELRVEIDRSFTSRLSLRAQ
jgi:hypothetical protein